MADMANGYEIRWAEDKDWIPAMHMIWKTFLKYEAVDYTEEGIRNFHEFITDEHLYKSFRQGRYQMMVALDGARIIGADRKSTRLNSSHYQQSRMPSSA